MAGGVNIDNSLYISPICSLQCQYALYTVNSGSTLVPIVLCQFVLKTTTAITEVLYIAVMCKNSGSKLSIKISIQIDLRIHSIY